MIEINVNKISKSYGFEKVLDELSFDVKTNDRVALIGNNGCGKSTTMKMIYGSEMYDSGSISIRNGATVGYLTQIPSLEKESVSANEVYLRGVRDILELEEKINTFVSNMDTSEKSIKILSMMQEEFRIKGGYNLNEKIEKIKYGFKISEKVLSTPYNNLSGGEKTIVNLASLILSNPSILLLDEPTNHLDIQTLEWFEEYLKTYNGTVVIVSHDRYFLDRVVNKIIEIDNGKASLYHGNYSYYLEESEKRFMLEFQRYKNQQKQIKALKEAIIRYKEWGSKSDNPMFFRRAHAIEKRLEKMEMIEKPKVKSELRLNLVSSDRSANNVLMIDKLNLQIDEKKLIDNSSMFVKYKDKVCLMGNNGCGKTTLIRNILNNTHESIKLGVNTVVGYIPQEIRFDSEELSIYEYTRSFFVGDESKLRSKLNQFYFGEESIDKKLKNLSGGEKVRIKLLELILLNANFLILDEPTNHIDIDTREILENALIDYDGTILFVSHDRYFINKIANKVIVIDNMKFHEFDGNYDSVKLNTVSKFKEVIPKVVEVKLKGSNRLNEFIKECKVELIKEEKHLKIYRIRKKSRVFYLKEDLHLSNESKRLEYLSEKLDVPEKVFYEKFNGKSYLMSKCVNGVDLTHESFKNNPKMAIDVIVEAINSLLSIDYSDCIIDETIDTKIKKYEDSIKLEDIKKEYIDRFHTKDAIIKYLRGNKPKALIGFIHGKLTLENIFAFQNKFSAFIDVSESGIGDLYYDFVSLELSIKEHYGSEYVDLFYESIGIDRDIFRSEYYSILLNK